MKLLVIGASKGIGLETVRYALGRGHDVRAFARRAEGIAIDDPKLEKVTGDAGDAAAVKAAVQGVDAVVMTLGLPKTLPAMMRKTTLFSDATRVLLPAMKSSGVRRLLAVTGFGAGDSKAKMSTVEKLGFKALLERAYADKTAQERLIRESGLDWTIARPGILTSTAPSHAYDVLVEPETWHNGLISRGDVAHFLVHAAEDASHIGEAPVLIR
ncbi:NAD-dependent epimerase/dehydratase family protein [Rhodovulum sp. BSW8]|uniref:NAD(P)H-binding protein n=1 Tax=Rhodovulum visakhapatnamense TaxID=364297 RepID=A0A4R8FTN0_9RHOB|nr:MULTISPECIES: NAD(P)H-binding protein [Rhodovulum]OLS42977.1 epimerase [Rhodovulum sulfidophilum]MBL3570150.1 NAD(P)H-binding protein [Rhodovulum visakhapatnamense]MBL3576947.1 NAD(P)H-binding protein [Rhodovulum visakhapatnamense]RBO53654.1 NAD-dependent epimerase/dehydratase family protein [Rhodovulum sp. BSW8]TDX28853.1 putative NADH-flavin reductase [Rhodovulum visakhapatnamense]